MIRYSLTSVTPGMKLGKPIYDINGKLLLGRGVILDDYFLKKLVDLELSSLYIMNDSTADIAPNDNLSEIVRCRTIKHIKCLFKDLEEQMRSIKGRSLSTIMKSITKKKFKKSFKKNPGFENIIEDARMIVDEVLFGETLLGLGSFKRIDDYTYQHSVDMTVIALLIGKKLGLPRLKLRDLAVGCLFHDIGRMLIDEEILHEDGTLSREEYEKVQSHSTIGYELTRDIALVGILPPHIALLHHEHQDGTGYPRGLYGDNTMMISISPGLIHLFGSIAAIADVYDALTSDREYRPALPREKVIPMMSKMSGTHLNHQAFGHFFAIAPPYPEGATIRVLNGPFRDHYGVVTHVNLNNPSCPQIRIVYDHNKNPIPPQEIDLAKSEDIKMETYCF